eukprot:gene10682-3303_t
MEQKNEFAFKPEIPKKRKTTWEEETPLLKKRYVSWTLTTLPNHVLSLIFSFVSQSFILSHIIKVSKKWSRLGMSKGLWESIDFQGFKVTTLPEVVSFLSSVMPEKNFEGKVILPKSCSKLSAANFKQLKNVYPKLSTLAIPPSVGDVSSISNSSLKQLAQFSNLKHLELINHQKITDLGMDFLTKKLKTLSMVVLDGCVSLTSKSLAFIFQRCPKLKQISLLTHESDKGVVIQDFELSEMVKEKKLFLKTCCLEFGKISYETLYKFVEQCPNIEKLCIKGFTSLDSKSIEIIFSNLKRLKEFIVCSNVTLYGPNFESESLEHLHFSRLSKFYAPVINCPKLKKLSFEQCNGIEQLDLNNLETLESLQIRSSKLTTVDFKILSKLTHLKELELFDLQCKDLKTLEVTSSSLNKLIFVMSDDINDLNLKCPKLETLSLDLCSELLKLNIDCPILNSFQLFILPQTQFPKLQNIHIKSQKLVNLNFHRAILLENASFDCENLDALNLSGCKELKELPKLNCPKLDKLALGSPHVQYSIDKIEEFTTNCPSISMLSISNAENLDDDCLAELCDKLNHLQALVISNCQNLKSPNLEAPNLKGIQMTDCTNMNNICVSSKILTKLFLRNCSTISDETVQSISKTCPNVKFLEIFNCVGVKYPRIDCQELTDLHFTKCENLIKPTLKCSKLKKLIFKQCPKMKDVNFEENESTSEILFSECNDLTDDIVESLKLNTGIQTLVFSKCNGLLKPKFEIKNLKQLRFVECNFLKSPFISKSNLSVLSFHDCKSLNFNLTSELLDVSVEVAEFVNCGSFVKILVDSEIRKISMTFCKNLLKFYVWNESTVKTKITFCPKLILFVTGTEKLKELSIKDCAALVTLSFTNCLDLKQIELVNCLGIKDDILSNLLLKCQELNNLDVSNCGLIKPTIIHSKLNQLSLSNCQSLESINLECESLLKFKLVDIYEFTSQNLISKNIEKLKEIEITNVLFNVSTLIEFLEKSKNLTGVNLKNTGISSLQQREILNGYGYLKNNQLIINNMNNSNNNSISSKMIIEEEEEEKMI